MRQITVFDNAKYHGPEYFIIFNQRNKSMLDWLTGTLFGKVISTFVISMVPFIELRAGLPFGIASGLSMPAALVSAILGNLVPVPFIILYIRKLFSWLRTWSTWFEKLVSGLEQKGRLKGETVSKYGVFGLILLVAIPLPGTGAWTGALVAAMLDIRMKRAIPAVFIGLILSAAIVSFITMGVIHVM